MNATLKALLAGVAVALLALGAVADAAPRHGGGSGGARPPSGSSGGGPGYGHRGGSGYHHYGGSGYGHSHGYHGSYWGWGVGLGIGVPWGWGWYEPYGYGPGWGYGAPYYAYPAYGYAAPYAYGYGCWPYGDCYREQAARAEPTPPTTEVPPPAPGESGMPTRRPLHLNYCDSAGAWFPQVSSCPGGWRLVLPDYSQGR